MRGKEKAESVPERGAERVGRKAEETSSEGEESEMSERERPLKSASWVRRRERE